MRAAALISLVVAVSFSMLVSLLDLGKLVQFDFVLLPLLPMSTNAVPYGQANLTHENSWKHDYSLMNFTGNGKSQKPVPNRRLEREGRQSDGNPSQELAEFVMYASIFGNSRKESTPAVVH